MKIGKRLLAAAVMVAMCVSMSTITVHAKEQLKDTFIEEFDPDNLKYYHSLSGNQILTGGVNELNGIQCTTRNDCEALEKYLRSAGYVLVTTDSKDISDENYDLLQKEFNSFLSRYMDRDNEVYWTKYRVYLNKETYDNAISEMKKDGSFSIETELELIDSSVVLNYAVWDNYDRKETVSRCKAADKMFIADPLTPKMVRVSSEVVNYYKNPENYTFFGREKDIISVQTSRDCEGAVKLLNEVFADNKAEILDFLQALSAKKKAEEKEKKEEEKSEVSVAGWNKKGA